MLDPTRTVLRGDDVGQPHARWCPMIRTILGGFLFSGDDVYKKVAVLSGGERNRLALAKMLLNAEQPAAARRAHEPPRPRLQGSPARRARGLRRHAVFVSHDRYFVDQLATKVIEVGGGEALVYPGGYEDFLYWKKQQARRPPRASAIPTRSARISTVRRRLPRRTLRWLRFQPGVSSVLSPRSPREAEASSLPRRPAQEHGGHRATLRPARAAPAPVRRLPERQVLEREAKRMRRASPSSRRRSRRPSSAVKATRAPDGRRPASTTTARGRRRRPTSTRRPCGRRAS